jgi:hypothetical protein
MIAPFTEATLAGQSFLGVMRSSAARKIFVSPMSRFCLSHQPSAISRQPSAIGRQPSAISHQPLAISH